MSEKPEEESVTGATEFSQQVGEKATRKLKAQRHVTQTVWSGLGMMGLIGWSVAVPTLLGAALGLWLDEHHRGSHSWTLMLLAIGLGLIGWSVAVSTVLGAALGLWLDEHHRGSHSWTLMLLAIGLGLGCFNAWHWVAKEDR